MLTNMKQFLESDRWRVLLLEVMEIDYAWKEFGESKCILQFERKAFRLFVSRPGSKM